MLPRRVREALLFKGFFVLIVPALGSAAFEAPVPNPLSFSLANLICFTETDVFPELQTAEFYLHTGAARLFGLPEVQPMFVQAEGRLLGGRGQGLAYSLNCGAYSETSVALGYSRAWTPSLKAGAALRLDQVSIKGYGSAFAPQLDLQAHWQVYPDLAFAVVGMNVTGSRFGKDHYPLPHRIALAGKFSLGSTVNLLLEVEKEPRYLLCSKFGLAAPFYRSLVLFVGLQSDPGIVSAGLSALIVPFRVTGAWQYHPDLGLSQCYGLLIAF